MQLNPNTVKALRQKHNWTQQHLADACDISLRTVQRVEKEGAASKETMMSLCAVLEVRPGTLIKLDEPIVIESHVTGGSLKLIIVATAVISFALGVASVFLILE